MEQWVSVGCNTKRAKGNRTVTGSTSRLQLMEVDLSHRLKLFLSWFPVQTVHQTKKRSVDGRAAPITWAWPQQRMGAFIQFGLMPETGHSRSTRRALRCESECNVRIENNQRSINRSAE